MHAVIPARVCVFAYECVKALTAFDSNLWNEAAAASQVLAVFFRNLSGNNDDALFLFL